MNIQLIKKEEQADGNFNHGEILEKKPIGFPQDGGKIRPYSNLFYWAHAWTPGQKSTIGLHPHQGFEICSFVLEGSINHYDTKQERWIPLMKGDVQIIRAGNGISHAEELNKHSEIFQIWFDPNIQSSMQKEATYDDYKNKNFEVVEKDGYSIKKIAGNGAPMLIESEGIEINSYTIESLKEVHLDLDSKSIYSYFIIDGEISLNDKNMNKGDFVIVSEAEKITFNSTSNSKIFEIKSPLRPSYMTYSERFMN